jgi:hypothetical protein
MIDIIISGFLYAVYWTIIYTLAGCFIFVPAAVIFILDDGDLMGIIGFNVWALFSFILVLRIAYLCCPWWFIC